MSKAVGQSIVGVEAGAIADQHRALEQVAVAVRPPGIANVVVAGEHIDAGVAKQQHGRKCMRPGRVGQDANAGLGEQVGGAQDDVSDTSPSA